jgi:tRNA (cytidine56-2'-O)-methyltransferase
MIYILRLNHRIPRDVRVSTHCALVGRAFGADGLFYSGMRDSGFEDSVARVSDNFGGDFFVDFIPNAVELVKDKKSEGWAVVHLTMYGLDFKKKLGKVKTKKNILVIAGGEKVEPIFYELADFNLAIGNQPHSEVGALAVFLYELNGPKGEFEGARMRVNPCERGKDIIRANEKKKKGKKN